MEGATMEITPQKLDNFMKGRFSNKIRKAYRKNSILHESDLQAYAWMYVREFLGDRGRRQGEYRVFNQRRVQAGKGRQKVRSHPDLVILKNKAPWVLIELKAPGKQLNEKSCKAVENYLENTSDDRIRRTYLVWVAKNNNRQPRSSRRFREIPIILGKLSDAEFKKRAKERNELRGFVH
jgi:hypothetical protein